MVAKCQCGGCKKYFVGPSIHDMHRVGEPRKGVKRRCLTTEEMMEQGFAYEQKQVKYRVENTPKMMQQDVWFRVANREAVTRHHKS